MIIVTTVRDQIRRISDAWDAYHPSEYWGIGPDRRDAISRKLAELDKEKATAEEIKAIIGNDSWTNLRCDSCKADNLPMVVTVGEESAPESATANLCYSCCGVAWTSMAARLLSDKP